MSELVTEFVGIRHGQTADNARQVLQGHLDTGLDSTGWRQAEALAARLRLHPRFDRVICSDLRRARETAAVLAEGLRLPVELEPDLREWHLGVLQGHPRARLGELFPEVMLALTPEGADMVIPGGESRRALERRVSGCVQRLLVASPGARLLLVTHGGTLRALFRYAVGDSALANHRLAIHNTSYSRFCHRDEGWQLICWNDTAHLSAEEMAMEAVSTDETAR